MKLKALFPALALVSAFSAQPVALADGIHGQTVATARHPTPFCSIIQPGDDHSDTYVVTFYSRDAAGDARIDSFCQRYIAARPDAYETLLEADDLGDASTKVNHLPNGTQGGVDQVMWDKTMSDAMGQ